MFPCNIGIAIPAANILNVLGSGSITTTGTGNTITITSSGGAGVTFTGDTGTPFTTSSVTIFTDQASVNCGSSVLFDASSPDLTLQVTDGNGNTLIGEACGTTSISGTLNTGLGLGVLGSATSASLNTAVGYLALNASQGDSFNTAIGWGTMSFLNGGQENTAVGFQSLNGTTADSYNTAVGVNSLLETNGGSGNAALGWSAGAGVVTGTSNLFLGSSTGISYTTNESNNILLNTNGTEVAGDQNTMRIGAGTGSGPQQLTTTFICGINGNTVSNPLMVTIDSLTNQLGVTSIPASITTLDGDTGSATPTAGVITIEADVAGVYCGSSVQFQAFSSTVLMQVTDVLDNTLIGRGCGNLSGTFELNTGVGLNVLKSMTTASGNSGYGPGSLQALTSGSDNCSYGYFNLTSLLTGGNNTSIGYNAGSNYVGAESSNVLLNNPGVAAESNVLRIGNGTGTGGQQLSTAFISGINGNTVSNALMVTIDSATDQLGVASIPAAATTFDGDTGSATPLAGVITIQADVASANCGSSVEFVASGSTVQLDVSDSNDNTIIGSGSGNGSISGTTNCSLGSGIFSGATTATGNCAVGVGAFSSLLDGNFNYGIGYVAFNALVSGGFNVGMGTGVGSGYTSSEGSNILFNNYGTMGESNTLRIGNGTGTSALQLSKAFISGINGNTVSSAKLVTIDSSTDQLGVMTIPVFGETITGNSGGALSPSAGNWNIVTANSTVTFAGSGSTLTQNFQLTNLLLGSDGSITSGTKNVGIGYDAAAGLTSGSESVAIGYAALSSASTATSNVAIGAYALLDQTTGTGQNVAVGEAALSNLLTGANNVVVGQGSGNNYLSSESNNIIIGQNIAGTTSESNVIRIGNSSNAACYVSGITGTTPTSANTPQVVLCDNTGKLSPISSSTSGYVLTSNGSATPSFQAPGSSSITLDGDSGTATGSTLTVYADLAGLNCGSSIHFSNSGSTSLLNVTSAVNASTVVGALSGNLAAGFTGNCVLGTGSLASGTTAIYNVSIGGNCFLDATSANFNVGIGQGAFGNLVSGAGNIGIGAVVTSGVAYTSSESFNILLNSTGVIGESNVIRISDPLTAGSYPASACYIGGIAGVTVSSPEIVVINPTSGQLGTVSISGFTWHDVTGGSATLAAQNGYVADSSSLTTFTMPTNNAIGDTIRIVGKGSGGWTIVYGASQNIIFGSTTTTTTTGNLASTNQNDCCQLVCTTASATAPIFTVESSIGNLAVT